jgi:hypothetical protein
VELLSLLNSRLLEGRELLIETKNNLEFEREKRILLQQQVGIVESSLNIQSIAPEHKRICEWTEHQQINL